MFARRRTPASGQSFAAADRTPSKREHYSQQTVDNLVAAGLVDLDSRRSKRRSRGQQVSQREPTPDPHHSSPNPIFSAAAGQQTPNISSSHENRLFNVQRGEEKRSEMSTSKAVRRNERTFMGASCSACEEPLEHMLRGERVLQLTCGHVAHEACFYEYIKEFEAQTCPSCEKPLGLDTSRGGNLDFENLNKLARSAQTPAPHLGDHPREDEKTSVPGTAKELHRASAATQRTTRHQASREHLLPEKVRSQSQSPSIGERSNPFGTHRRAASDESETNPQDYAGSLQIPSRRPDSTQSIQPSIGTPRHTTRNPIPAPLVTARSEFPTLSKSRHQQSLTCLVTIEVLEGKWNPRPDDIRVPHPVPTTISEEPFEPPVLPQSIYQRPVDSVHEDIALEGARDELFKRVSNWHGLDGERFGKLFLHGVLRVGKDGKTWQDLECYLFSEMLICVKERKLPLSADNPNGAETRCTIKGSILVKKHLTEVKTSPENDTLTLALSVSDLPAFHLRFQEPSELEAWRNRLNSIILSEPLTPEQSQFADGNLTADQDEHSIVKSCKGSMHSSAYARPVVTDPAEHSSTAKFQGTSSLHIPLDIVIVIPVTASMQGLKMNLLRDSLRFIIASLGEQDRLGLVSFGSGGGGVPLIGLTGRGWSGWGRALESIRPVAHKNMRADVTEGANEAMDLLMSRRNANQLSHIILISDSSTSDSDGIDFVVSRAEAAKIPIHSFGLGLTHKPDSMVELSTRTKASYTYVKDWMMLRECLAGCLGSLQSTSHQNVKLKLRLPDGSPAKFVKITGALQVTKRAAGSAAECFLGDLRFGDKRDVLVQLAIQPDHSSTDLPAADPWRDVISGMEAMGNLDSQSARRVSIEEIPLLQADLVWSDLLRGGIRTQLPRPSLLAITMLPSNARQGLVTHPGTPPIPPHPAVVQRRMELLTSDMLSRALCLVSRAQHDRALHLLNETRLILKGLGKGGLPPLPSPPPSSDLPSTPRSLPPTPGFKWDGRDSSNGSFSPGPLSSGQGTPSSTHQDVFKPFSIAAEIDKTTLLALDSELDSSLEWISHPAVFGRDARKAVLQAIGTINSQRGYTFRTPSESLWAMRIPGVRRLGDLSRQWRETSEDSLLED